MYKKTYNPTVYYVNYEPQLRPITKDGRKNQFVNIMSIYGKALVITPARCICNKYDVCMEINHANNWLKKHGITVSIPTDFNSAIVLDWDIKLGRALADCWEKYLSKNIAKGYLVECIIPTDEIKKYIEAELSKYDISYSMFLRGNICH